MSFGVVLWSPWKIMHAAVYFNRDTGFANGEIHCVPANLMLAHNVDAMLAQFA